MKHASFPLLSPLAGLDARMRPKTRPARGISRIIGGTGGNDETAVQPSAVWVPEIIGFCPLLHAGRFPSLPIMGGLLVGGLFLWFALGLEAGSVLLLATGAAGLALAMSDRARPQLPMASGTINHTSFDREAAMHGQSPGHERLLLTAGVTHELRTPLTILKGRLHGIEDGVITPDHDETARLLRQVEHVLEIVNDLDMLSQVELGRLTLNRRRVCMADVAASVVSDLRPLFERHDISIVESYDETVVHADPVRLRQIIINLVTNAAKHSPVSGEIRVEVRRRGVEVSLSVRDEGPGFSTADHDRMFSPFWRSPETVRRPGCTGTGMGLALTAGLVDAHGGRIVAENRNDRSGACFRVILPADQ